MTTNPRHAMQRAPRTLGTRVLLLVAGFFLASAGAALAFFVISVNDPAGNDALAQGTNLVAPTAPTATANGSGAITIGWSPSSQPSGVVAQYRVTRTSGPGSPTTVCTVAPSVTSCQDTGLNPTTAYQYSVVAVLDNWQSSAANASTTTATPSYAITLSPGPYTAGTPITVQTITAKLGGITDTTYTGSKTINWSGLLTSPSGHAPTYPSGSVTFSNGVASPSSTFTAYAGGASSLVATDANSSGVTGSAAFTINAGTLDHFTFAAAGTETDGLAFTGTNTLTAQDIGGNTITTFNAASNNVTLSANTPLTGTVSGLHGSNVLNQSGDFTNGVANLTSLGMTYTGNAITGTFTATSGGKTGTSGSVAIGVGALDHFAFAVASPQTNGTVFTGTNTVTAQDIGNNTITTYSAASNPVTITAVSPLTGTISGLHGSNVLNQSGDFSSGVANLTTLGMTYTGNATTGTFKATSGTKTGTSGSVVINAGALASFTFSAATPQTNGVAFTGTNTLTAKDGSGNTIANFNASSNNVTITAVSPLTGSVSGLHGSNVLNQAGDFSSGVANLTTLGMTYTGNAATGTFTATSGGKTGTSGSVVINVGALDHFVVATPSALVATPAAPTASATCPFTCSTTYHYEVTAVNAAGETLPGASVSVSNNTLGNCFGGFFGQCTNTVTAPAALPTGATSFNLYRSSGSGAFGLVASGLAAGAQVSDGGLAAGVAPPTIDTATTAPTIASSFGETISAADIGGNPASGWTSATNCVTFSGPSSSPSNTAPIYGTQGSCGVGQTSAVFNSSGQATVSITLFDAQTTTLTVTSVTAPAGKTGTSAAFTVNPGALDHFTFAAASTETDGVAFTGTNTLTAQDIGGNTITTFNASTNNVTLSANTPLTGTVSGLDTPANVLNQAGDFSSGVANLTSLGMTYTGNATTGTFTATSGGKTGTSGSVAIGVGALDHFAFSLASPQTNGTVFTGTNTVTAQDIGNNTITTYSAASNPSPSRRSLRSPGRSRASTVRTCSTRPATSRAAWPT